MGGGWLSRITFINPTGYTSAFHCCLHGNGFSCSSSQDGGRGESHGGECNTNKQLKNKAASGFLEWTTHTPLGGGTAGLVLSKRNVRCECGRRVKLVVWMLASMLTEAKWIILTWQLTLSLTSLTRATGWEITDIHTLSDNNRNEW